MNKLELTSQEEIKRLIEYVLEPISGKVVSFESSHDMYCGIRSAYSTENIFLEKNKVSFYPIIINTKLGELRMSIQSIYLNDLKLAIGIAFGYSTFVEKNKLSDKISMEIQKRIYS